MKRLTFIFTLTTLSTFTDAASFETNGRSNVGDTLPSLPYCPTASTPSVFPISEHAEHLAYLFNGSLNNQRTDLFIQGKESENAIGSLQHFELSHTELSVLNSGTNVFLTNIATDFRCETLPQWMSISRHSGNLADYTFFTYTTPSGEQSRQHGRISENPNGTWISLQTINPLSATGSFWFSEVPKSTPHPHSALMAAMEDFKQHRKSVNESTWIALLRGPNAWLPNGPDRTIALQDYPPVSFATFNYDNCTFGSELHRLYATKAGTTETSNLIEQCRQALLPSWNSPLTGVKAEEVFARQRP